jgi:hypothetical protein
MFPSVITLTVKLEWYRKNAPGRVDWAKDLFIDTVSRHSKMNIHYQLI